MEVDVMIRKLLYKFFNGIYRGFVKCLVTPGLKASFGSCGSNVKVSYDFDVRGVENIYVGDNCQIGPHCLFWTTRARIIIKDSVLMGPRIAIITGDHKTDTVGKHIIDVTDEEKSSEYDKDVVIESGVWLSSNVTILKGVTIGEGAVVAAGAVVTKDLEPYGIYGGVPAKKIGNRFTDDDLEEHIRKLNDVRSEK